MISRMRSLLVILLGLGVIIGLSAGPAMAIQIYTGTTASPGTVLFYDDFESAVLGGVPDNGASPGQWVNAVTGTSALGGDATVQNSNPWDGSQHLRREQLNGSSHPSLGATVGQLASPASSGTVHFETMFSWQGNNNNFNDNIGLAASGGSESDFYFAVSMLHNQMYFRNADNSTNGYFFNSGEFDFDAGDYHKFEVDHTIGTDEFTFTVTDMVNDPTGPEVLTIDMNQAASTDIGVAFLKQGNDFLQVDYDNVGPMVVPEPGTAALLVAGLLSLACLRRRKRE